MSFAQKNYTQPQGSSDYSIADAGSLLTAFANLLSDRFGMGYASPDFLNDFLRRQNIDPFGRLTWAVPSIVDPTLIVKRRGTGAPDANDAIVVLHNPYNGDSLPSTTYAVVVDAENGMVISSYDGELRHWSAYGDPTEYVVYERVGVIEPSVYPVTIAPQTAPEDPQEAPAQFTAHIYLDGFESAEDAYSGTNSIGIVYPGDYVVLGETNGMMQITKQGVDVELWVNPEKNVVPDETATLDLTTEDPIDTTKGIYEANQPEVVIPVKPAVPDWQKTYRAGLGTIDAYATEDIDVVDLAGKLPDQKLPKGWIAHIAGKFEKDGEIYFRTVKSVELGRWYGIPREKLRRVTNASDNDEDTIDSYLESLRLDDSATASDHVSVRDGLIRTGATLEGKVKRVFTRKG